MFSSLAYASQLESWMNNKIIGCIINSDCISAPYLFCWTCLVHKEVICHWGAWMAWYKTICCLDQEYMYPCTRLEYMYVFDCLCHCMEGLHKFMMTCIDQYRATSTGIKLRSVRLLCRMRLGVSKNQFPIGKLILDLLLAVRKCSCQT